MLRVFLMVLTILVSYDHLVHNGKFTWAAVQASHQILHHFGVG